MTLEEYLNFLVEFWELFGPPPPRIPRADTFMNMKL